MVLPSSGAISLTNIETEFGGSPPISITEYYARAINIPASGTIAFSNFYGGFAIAGRGIFGGGLIQQAPDVHTNTLDYITISTSGNATDFGDLSSALRGLGSCSSTTRALFAGGLQLTPVVSYRSAITYSTIATTGNVTAFGDLTVSGRLNVVGCSSPTRGVFAGGFIFPAGAPAGSALNTIDYVTIATIGNATDFGDLSTVKQFSDNACSSSVRGVFIGGFDTAPATGAYTATYNTIDYITIATTGNTTSFGTISFNHDHGTGACSSPSRGVFGGGGFQAQAGFDAPLTPGSFFIGNRTAEYLTIATTGNSTSFGNLNTTVEFGASTSNSIRGIFAGGTGYLVSAPTILVTTNVIDYFTIATIGSAIDFGDLTVARQRFTACSDSDGGIVAAGGGGGGGGGGTSIGPGVGVFGGGFSYSAEINTIQYVTIATTGNATDFGDLSLARSNIGACSSSTRGLFGGGNTSITPEVNTIDYVTITTTGNATDFGDLTVARAATAGCSSPTRGIFGSSVINGGRSNTIDYITIATTGNATDFGDLTVSRGYIKASSSPTRGVFGGGFDLASGYTNVIDYITIATTGNATDFGDLTLRRDMAGACSSSTRGIFGGGAAPPTNPLLSAASNSNIIDYITIATTGNATDFGDLTIARYAMGACSSSTRGVFGGGTLTNPSPLVITYYNIIDYITIATTGNATDFGDLILDTTGLSACSDSHGGLDGGGGGGGGGSIGPGVGLFAGGSSPVSGYNTIDYVTIATTGNAADFGDLTASSFSNAACSSATRGVFAVTQALPTLMSYVTLTTAGNAQSFGNLIQTATELAGCSSPTRGIFGGGFVPTPPGSGTNVIQFITIATTGNATDFGDLTIGRYNVASCSSPTRGLFAGGATTTYQNVIDYVTIATTGNATDFGDIFPDSFRNGPVGCSSPTRGIFAGGFGTPTYSNVISYVTIATTGNATDFGDLTQGTTNLFGCSSPTRGVFGGGQRLLPAPTAVIVNNIEYITIATTGNATDFGDLTLERSGGSACSDSHGGLA